MSNAAVAAMSSYAILGCGSVGFAVSERLIDQDKEVLIVDHDTSRVEALRDQDFNAKEADITDPEVARELSDRDVILIMAADPTINKTAVENIREQSEDPFIVVRAEDPVSSEELDAAGADVVITPAEVIADYALRSLESGELQHKAAQLQDVLRATTERVGILTRGIPDADALASAAALQTIAEHFGVEADILYSGDLGHHENRAFVNLLDIELTELSADAEVEYDTIAVFDHRLLAESDRSIDILIDHTDPDEEPTVAFQDVRPNMSSVSTIMTKYVQEYDMYLEEIVATALLYGIRTETVDFKRETTPADLTAAAYLYPFAAHETLEQVESPSMSPETLDVLAEAIHNRDVRGSHLVSSAGFVTDDDALSEAAQHLLNLEGVTTAAVFGITDEQIYIAAQSRDIRIDIGNVLSDAYAELGETIGHSKQATAAIPLGIFTGLEVTDENRDQLLELTETAVKTKLFEEIGVDGSDGNGS